MTPLIESDAPDTWQELEARVARILEESGYAAEVQKTLRLARGQVNVDVWADEQTNPSNVIAVECKHWRTAVSQDVVHGFRTVVGDSGANMGLIVSTGGFQRGAIEAATYSNVRLADWATFQEMFVERWYNRYMAPRLREEAFPLVEYTEPINSRILRKAEALSADKREQFKVLRQKHLGLGLGFLPLYMAMPHLGEDEATMPELPLRAAMMSAEADMPPDVLDATALRPLLEALSAAYGVATAEFDHLFGERA